MENDYQSLAHSLGLQVSRGVCQTTAAAIVWRDSRSWGQFFMPGPAKRMSDH